MKTRLYTRKRALISSVAMLLVAMIALGTATFAWFSTKTSADASSLSVKTTQGTNLMISEAKDTGWTQDLTFTNTATTKLDPATTDDLSAFYSGKADGFDTIAIGSGGYETANEGDHYITQVVYVKYDAEAGDMNLNAVLTPTVNKDASQNPIGSTDYYRVAVEPVSSSTDSDLQDAEGAVNKYYSPSTPNLVSGATHATYSAQTSNTVSLGKIKAKNADGSQAIYAYKFYIWFEGEDADCKDTNAKNDISLSIQFTKGA
ncbi:MAG: hypothetical protein ACI4RI_03705 [Ruminococcus sp.]